MIECLCCLIPANGPAGLPGHRKWLMACASRIRELSACVLPKNVGQGRVNDSETAAPLHAVNVGTKQKQNLTFVRTCATAAARIVVTTEAQKQCDFLPGRVARALFATVT